MEGCSKFPRFILKEASIADKVTKVSNSESCSRGRHTPQTYRRALPSLYSRLIGEHDQNIRRPASLTSSSSSPSASATFFTSSVSATLFTSPAFHHYISTSQFTTSLPSLLSNTILHHNCCVSSSAHHQQHNHTRTSASRNSSAFCNHGRRH